MLQFVEKHHQFILDGHWHGPKPSKILSCTIQFRAWQKFEFLGKNDKFYTNTIVKSKFWMKNHNIAMFLD